MAKTNEQLMQELEELKKRNAELEEAAKPKPEVVNNDPNRREKIRLFKDSGKYSQPYHVSVNDYDAIIQRGVEVEVPYYVAKHLEEIAEQDAATANMIGKLTAEWEDKSRHMR